VSVSILGALILTWLAVQTVSAGSDHKRHKRIVIEQSGEPKAFLGVHMQELDEEVLKGLDTRVKRGVLVTDVIEGSPADKAGLEEGDIIVEFQGKKVTSPDQLQELVSDSEIGDEIKIKLVRDKKSKTFEVTLGDWADQPAITLFGRDGGDFSLHMDKMKNYVTAFMPKRLGVRVSDVNEDLGSYFGVKEGEGVLVLDVDDESTADAAGVKAGDVIVEVQGEDVSSASDIRESISDLDPGDDVNLTVVRKKKRIELKGEMTEGGEYLYNWHSRGPRVRSFKVPDIEFEEELRQELDELRKEIEELKKELKKS
jgi:serine protease Do